MRSDTLTAGSGTPFPEVIAALRQYRLEKNFTYRKLGQLIGVGYSGLFNVMNTKDTRVNDRTKYRIEKFAHSVGILSERRRAS